MNPPNNSLGWDFQFPSLGSQTLVDFALPRLTGRLSGEPFPDSRFSHLTTGEVRAGGRHKDLTAAINSISLKIRFRGTGLDILHFSASIQEKTSDTYSQLCFLHWHPLLIDGAVWESGRDMAFME